MLTILEMARAEFGFYAAHIAVNNGEVEPLHGHTFQVTLRVSGEPDTSGMVAQFSAAEPVDAAHPGHVDELDADQEHHRGQRDTSQHIRTQPRSLDRQQPPEHRTSHPPQPASSGDKANSLSGKAELSGQRGRC
jgi:hypothetical protein